MTPFMLSLRSACRAMLLVWLVLLVAMSALVAGATRTPISGNLLAFLLSSSPQPAPVLPVRPPQPAPEPTPPPPVVEAPAPEPVPEWRPLPRGKKQGSGILKGPEVTQLADGSVEVVFSYQGEGGKPGDPGSATAMRASARATSVDLHGPWKRLTYLNKAMGKGAVLSRLQVAEHPGYLRVSATAHGPAPKEVTEYTADRIRIIFSAQDAPKTSASPVGSAETRGR